MVSECLVSLLSELSLLIFLLLLFSDHAEEFIAFGLCLLGKHNFALDELTSAGNIKISCLFSLELSLFFFFSACLALTFFKCTLGA